MEGRRNRRRARAERGRVPGADHPIEDLDPGIGRVGIDDEDALRREGAVRDLLLVRVFQRLGDLANDAEFGVDRKLRAALRQVVIQTNAVPGMLEDDGGAEAVLDQRQRLDDSRVADAADHLQLALGGADEGLAVDRRGRVGDGVEPEAVEQRGNRGVPGQEILIDVARALEQQFGRLVLIEATMVTRTLDAGFVERLREALDGGLVRKPGRRRGKARRVPVLEGRDDSRARRYLLRARHGVAVSEADARAPRFVEAVRHLGVREEDQRFDSRHSLLEKRRLPGKERGEAFGLQVRESQWVVVGAHFPARRLDNPLLTVSADFAWPALDLDQKDAGRSGHQEIDLVQSAVSGHELEVRPSAPWLVVREPFAHEGQGLLFPWKLGSGHARPPLFGHSHRTGLPRVLIPDRID